MRVPGSAVGPVVGPSHSVCCRERASVAAFASATKASSWAPATAVSPIRAAAVAAAVIAATRPFVAMLYILAFLPRMSAVFHAGGLELSDARSQSLERSHQ